MSSQREREKKEFNRHCRAFAKQQGYTIVSELGSGAFGFVYSAIGTRSNHVAIKVMKLVDDDSIREIHLHHAVAKHLPNLMIVSKVLFDDKSNFMLMEMPVARGGTLKDYLKHRLADNHVTLTDLKNNNGYDMVVPVREVINLLCNMACGLTALHAVGIMHLDIKTHNVLLMKPYADAVLSDFGLSAFARSIEKRTNDLAITSLWRPYEHFVNPTGQPTLASDIWSFGIIVFEFILCITDGHAEDIHAFPTDSFEDADAVTKYMREWQGLDPNQNAVESKLANIDTMLEKTRVFYGLLKTGEQYIQDTFVASKLIPFLKNIAAQCLCLDPQRRSSAAHLMVELYDFAKTANTASTLTCLIQRTQVEMKIPQVSESKEPQEETFIHALLEYANAKDVPASVKQAQWITQQARHAIKKWKISNTDVFNAMLVRILIAMMFWSSGNDKNLWTANYSSLTTFLKQIGVVLDTQKSKRGEMYTLIEALKPWIVRLEEWSTEENTDLFSEPVDFLAHHNKTGADSSSSSSSSSATDMTTMLKMSPIRNRQNQNHTYQAKRSKSSSK